MKKFYFLLLTVCISFLFNTNIVDAQKQESIPEKLIYNITEFGEEKEITFTNSNNEVVTISVECYPENSKISSGTYKVSKSVKGSWAVSYDVKINSKEQITGATNLNIQAFKGSITSSSLTHTSSKATCNFTQKAGTVSTKASVVATIVNGNLIVT